MGEKVKGNLVLIGGREDKQDRCEILRAVARLAGGSRARLALVTVASRDPGPLERQYREVFERLGVERVEAVSLDDRSEARSSRWQETLEEATGIFITGGDQLRLTAILGGTPLDDILHRQYEQGVVIAGTSAGASAMTDTMIIGGPEDETPGWAGVRMAPGLGLLRETVVDQHFAQRGRIGRLLGAMAQNPYILALGLDEDTALVVDPRGRGRVLGARTAMLLDGRPVTHTNASESDPRTPLALWGAVLHVLPSGYSFDLRTRQPLAPRGDRETEGESVVHGDQEDTDL